MPIQVGSRLGPYEVLSAIGAGGMGEVWRAEDSLLNRAVAVAKLHGPQAALDMIAPLEESLAGYFYYFGAQGAFLAQLGRVAEARAAFDRAIGLANTPAEAAHIRRHLDRLTRTA